VELGLKTGMYYLRTKAATEAIKFTVDVKNVRSAAAVSQKSSIPEVGPVIPLTKKDENESEQEFECLACGS